MKKILILGSGGMLGHMVYHYFKFLDKYQILDASFPHEVNPESHLLDVTNKTELESFVLKNKPDIIINCIGILLKGSSEDPSNAIYLNAYFPHQLSKILRTYGGKLIHISTDCVFSGDKGGYIETDFKDARDTYGLSKALGEVDNDHDLTMRTSIIGPEIKEKGEGLFHWFMKQSGEINGYTKMIWGGVTTLELAKAINYAIENNKSGLVHITNGEPISKFELISLINKIWRESAIPIQPIAGKSVDKSLKTCRKDFGFTIRSYSGMLQDQYEWMQSNEHLYKSIY